MISSLAVQVSAVSYEPCTVSGLFRLSPREPELLRRSGRGEMVDPTKKIKLNQNGRKGPVKAVRVVPSRATSRPSAAAESEASARHLRRRSHSDIAVRAVGLTKDFATVRAVDSLDLEVPRGSVFGFLGPNGAGKTTTIRILLGLLEPTRGSASVVGFESTSRSEEVRKRCGVLLEHSGLIERLAR